MPRSLSLNDNDPTSAMRGLLPALALAAFVFAAGVVALYAPPAQGQMAVVFPFGTDERTAYYTVLAAGGRFVGASRLSNIVVAYATDTEFGNRIRAAGALFTLAAQGLCGPVAADTTRS